MEGIKVWLMTCIQGISTTNIVATYAKSDSVSIFKIGAYRGKGIKICSIRERKPNMIAYQ